MRNIRYVVIARAILSLFLIALPSHACFDSYVVLAESDWGPFESQHKGDYPIDDKHVISVFKAPGTAPALLHPRAVQGLIAATHRFTKERGTDSDYVFSKQKDLDPTRTSYYVLGRPGERRRAYGMGLLIDGRDGTKVQTEMVFPEIDFRQHPEAGPIRLMEVARLGIEAEEKGGLRYVFKGMARSLVAEYGSVDKIPSDLYLILHTVQQPLTGFYESVHGFKTWQGPILKNGKLYWVMGMRGADFVRWNTDMP